MALIKWMLDPEHSEILFKVKHLMISTVTGTFKTFDIEVQTNGNDFTSVENCQISIHTNSINTNNEARDHHLRSSDFFDVRKYPQILFSAGNFNITSGESTITGDLTIKGIIKPVDVTVELAGITLDSYGQTKAGLSASGEINRRDFGLIWGAVTEAGSIVVSDTVRFNAEIQMIRLIE